MPPGEHAITPMDEGTGEGVDLTINVDASVLDLLASDADKIRASGHELYIDFNHNDDGGAAGWVESFYWAGEDPETGGIRANVKWSGEGVSALSGKKFKRFSPTFRTEDGKVTGLGSANVGGLTNRPAFTTNQAVVAKNQEPKTKMDPEDITKIAALVTASLGKTVKAEEDDKKKDDELSALKAENQKLKDDKKDSDAKSAKAAEEEDEKKDEAAKSAVDKAIKSGAVAPKDEAKIVLLTAAAKQSPEAFEMLLSASKAPKQGSPRTVPVFEGDAAAGLSPEQQISSAVKAHKATTGEDTASAFSAVQATRPELFA